MKVLRETLVEFAEWTKQKVRIHSSDDIDFYFHEREIWWSSLGKNIGFEQDGKNDKFERPVLVLKKFNKNILWVLPLTRKGKDLPYYYRHEQGGEESFVILSQIRLISSKRLQRRMRLIEKREFSEIRQMVKEFLE